jgi:hypothetical protein
MTKTLSEMVAEFFDSNVAVTQQKKLSFLESRLEELKDIEL